ncbi:MAG: XRE family transcriptional regulator, partial [Proteobacteria bacterium]
MKKKQISKAKRQSKALLPRKRSSKAALTEGALQELTTLTRLGSNLQTMRVRLGLTQKVMAELCQLQVATISKVEKGDPGVRLGTLQSYLDAINLTITLQEKEI